MCVDDTVLYIHGKSATEVATKLSKVMNKVSDWLYNSCLTLNADKTVTMFFTNWCKLKTYPEIVVNWQKIKHVEQGCQTDPVKVEHKNTPDPNQVCSCLVGWLVGWSKSGVFLLGWNENLQPHGPLLDQFDTPDVEQFKYLGVTLDPTLSFKGHVKKLSNTLKHNLANFRYIRNSLTIEASSTYLNAMIISHFFVLYHILVSGM